MSPNENQSPDSASDRQLAILHEWTGQWATEPKNAEEWKASELVRGKIRFTKAGSFVSPVAVATIDILGIKALLKIKPLEEIARLFVEPFYDLNGPLYQFGQSPLTGSELKALGFQRRAGIYSATIADTILLARRPDWELGDSEIAEAEAVVWLAEYVCKVMKINSSQDIRLRSAISFGDCILTIGNRFSLLGEATGESFEWERSQEWIGGMLTPSAIAALKRGAEEAQRINGVDFVVNYPNWLVEYSIPLKPGSINPPTPRIALNWITGYMPGTLLWNANVPTMPGAGEVPEDVRRKIANTIAFSKHCERVGDKTVIDWKLNGCAGIPSRD